LKKLSKRRWPRKSYKKITLSEKGEGRKKNLNSAQEKNSRRVATERNKDMERKEGQRERVVEQGKLSWRLNKIARKEKECCQCGAKRHFRISC